MDVRFCIAGGGPAGVMLGYLLARAGYTVAILEKHKDFFRDFRGDTIHPSTMDVLHELGLFDAFMELQPDRVTELGGMIGETPVKIADFRRLPTRSKFLAFLPQWDFLDFLSREGRRYPGFRLMLESEAVELVIEEERVVGVVAATPQGKTTLRAGLVVAADGRHSDVRRLAGAPIDVLWLRLSRRPDDPGQAFGRVDRGAFLILIDRGEYYQCGFVIRKGEFEAIKAAGIDAFQQRIRKLAPFLAERVHELSDWSQVSLLTVQIDRLERWYREGLLCIGDAALAAVQRRRLLPARLTQLVQIAIQNAIVVPTLSGSGDTPLTPPLPIRILNRVDALRTVPAYVIGVGFRPEHVNRRIAAR
jgi:2-polyprenyl-6-methoxyphenol hydroxylase-like FAD-dependent oxidoreductase